MPDWLVYVLAYTFGSMLLGFCFVHGALAIQAVIEYIDEHLSKAEYKYVLITYWIVGSIALTLWVSW